MSDVVLQASALTKRFTEGRLDVTVLQGVDLQVRAGGEVRVGLLEADGTPVAGHSIADCDPLTGDHIAATVTWGGKAGLSAFANRPVRLEVRIRDARLYAFQFAR